MLTTLELRWFYPGILPPEIQDWFMGDTLGDFLQPPEDREDVYLLIPQCEQLGIKLREGQLEIKWRKAELGLLRFGDNVTGKAEKWMKWTCEEPTAESLMPASVAQKQSWVAIKKVRSQRHYQVSVDASSTPMPVQQPVPQGCSVELTELGIQGNQWWSFAFEVFSDRPHIKLNLQNLVTVILKTYQGPILQEQNSYAYPQWFSMIIQ